MMVNRNIRKKRAAVYISLAGITALVYFLHFYTDIDKTEQLDIAFQRLYFIPTILACIWFSRTGGMLVTVATGLLILPNIVIHWGNFSGADINRIAQLIVFFAVSAILGWVVELQRKEQRRVRETEKLAAIGKSLAAVAHDMKTPLVTIGGLALLVRKHLPENSPDRDKLEIVAREVERLELMLKNMLDFSKPLSLSCEKTDIPNLLRECVGTARGIADERRVSLEVEVSDELRSLNCDAPRLKQAIVNLVANAVQASPEGEKVLIRGYIGDGNPVFEIIDCGCGVPLQQRQNIFEPFFTTRKEGTGLGLPIVKKIIDAHNGRIDIENNPPGGTTFRVTLFCEDLPDCCTSEPMPILRQAVG